MTGSIGLAERRHRAELLRGRECRRFAVDELRGSVDGAVLTLDGYASVTNVRYDMGFYTEQICRGAFAKTLAERPDVQLLINHEGLPIARTGRNMELSEDGRGLRVIARLDADDPDVQRVSRKIDAGLIDQMSFAFRVTRQRWNEDYDQRDIQEVNIDRGDVSVVNQGASPTTTVSVSAGSPGYDALKMPLFEHQPTRTHDLDLYRARAWALRSYANRPPVATRSQSRRGPDLDLYRARAYASGLRGARR